MPGSPAESARGRSTAPRAGAAPPDSTSPSCWRAALPACASSGALCAEPAEAALCSAAAPGCCCCCCACCATAAACCWCNAIWDPCMLLQCERTHLVMHLRYTADYELINNDQAVASCSQELGSITRRGHLADEMAQVIACTHHGSVHCRW